MDAQAAAECQTSYPDGDKITSIISYPEGPMTIIAPQLINKYDVYDSELPEGSGVFQIETQRNGKALDLMELRYETVRSIASPPPEEEDLGGG